MILGVKIQNIGARVCGARQRERTRVKVFILQKFQGAQISIFFFVKIGMKLPFTIKNKRKNTNLKFEF